MSGQRKNRISQVVVTGAMLGTLGTLGGCVSYTNVSGPESPPAFQSTNHFQSVAVIRQALVRVVAKHPVSGQYAINLPAGASPESYEKVVAKLPEGAIIPSEGMSSEIPVYHIGRVWIRASDAKVDVVYPFTRADGRIEDQNVTIWLSGGVRKWRVYREQHWAAGTISTPPVYVPVWPEEKGLVGPGDEPDEAIDSSDAIESEIPQAQSAPGESAGHHGHEGRGYHEVPVED